MMSGQKAVTPATPEKRYENLLLGQDISTLHLDADTADVRFIFREKNKRKQIIAHKVLLAARSDVFRAMFYGALKEEGDVTIVDTSVAAFAEFLQFFYLTDVGLTIQNVLEVVNLAKKYNVAALATCELFLKHNVTDENVCFVYNLAFLFDLADLKKKCEDLISSNTKKMFSSTSFLECSPSMLSYILKLDAFLCQEIDVFHACMNWVKARTKQQTLSKEIVRDNLGDVFYEIRFRSMSFENFADLTPEYGQLFSLEEYQDIVQLIRSKDFQSTMFNNKSRNRRHSAYYY